MCEIVEKKKVRVLGDISLTELLIHIVTQSFAMQKNCVCIPR